MSVNTSILSPSIESHYQSLVAAVQMDEDARIAETEFISIRDAAMEEYFKEDKGRYPNLPARSHFAPYPSLIHIISFFDPVNCERQTKVEKAFKSARIGYTTWMLKHTLVIVTETKLLEDDILYVLDTGFLPS